MQCVEVTFMACTANLPPPPTILTNLQRAAWPWRVPTSAACPRRSCCRCCPNCRWAGVLAEWLAVHGAVQRRMACFSKL